MKNWAEITDCEIMIMAAVYSLEKAGCEVSMQKVTEYVNAEKNKSWKQQTVSTFMARLRNKGFLDMERKGRVFVYKSRVAVEEIHRGIFEKYADLLFDGDIEKFAAGNKALDAPGTK